MTAIRGTPVLSLYRTYARYRHPTPRHSQLQRQHPPPPSPPSSSQQQQPILKYFADHILPQIKSNKIVQRTLELTKPVKWSENLLKEILIDFKKNKQRKQLKNSSIEIGIELSDHNGA